MDLLTHSPRKRPGVSRLGVGSLWAIANARWGGYTFRKISLLTLSMVAMTHRGSPFPTHSSLLFPFLGPWPISQISCFPLLMLLSCVIIGSYGTYAVGEGGLGLLYQLFVWKIHLRTNATFFFVLYLSDKRCGL